MSVFNLLAERLAERVGCPVTAIKPETTFGSLGLDSLDLADLLIELENFLGIEIEADGKIQTLNDMTKLVERFVGAISDYCSGESMRQQVAFSGGVGTAKLKISSDHTEGTGV